MERISISISISISTATQTKHKEYIRSLHTGSWLRWQKQICDLSTLLRDIKFQTPDRQTDRQTDRETKRQRNKTVRYKVSNDSTLSIGMKFHLIQVLLFYGTLIFLFSLSFFCLSLIITATYRTVHYNSINKFLLEGHFLLIFKSTTYLQIINHEGKTLIIMYSFGILEFLN